MNRQVSWYEVYEYVQPYLPGREGLLIPGTPAWRQLPDGPTKRRALLWPAVWWAVSTDADQSARAEAAAAISEAADWAALARRTTQGRAAYIPPRRKGDAA